MDFKTVSVYLVKLMSTVLILLSMMSPALSGPGTEYTAENPDELILGVAVVSDIHVETNNPESYKKYCDVLQGIKAGKNLDAAVYTGDNVMNGQFLENVLFYSALRVVSPAKENFVVVGNHDLGNGAGDHEKSAIDFIANNNLYLGKNLDTTYYYQVVNGCYMIFLATEDGDPSIFRMSDEQLLWLEDVLKEANEKDAPILVFNHFPLSYLSERENTVLADLLSKYGTDLFVHGHIHDHLGEDNFYSWRSVDCINLPRVTEIVEYEAGDGIFVEVYENEILVRGRDFISGEWIEGLEYRYSMK